EAGDGLRHEDGDVLLPWRGRVLVVVRRRGRGLLAGGLRGAGLLLAPLAAARPAGGRGRRLHTLEVVVVEELVAGRRQQRRGGLAHADPDHPLVQLAQLVDQRGEVAVAGADDERRDVVADERQLHGVDRHLDVGGVLAGRAHPLGHLDELDVRAGQHPPVLVEVGPVGIRPPHHHAAPLGEGVADGPQVEEHAAEVLPRPEGEVLVVQEECDPVLVVHALQPRGSSPPGQRQTSMTTAAAATEAARPTPTRRPKRRPPATNARTVLTRPPAASRTTRPQPADATEMRPVAVSWATVTAAACRSTRAASAAVSSAAPSPTTSVSHPERSRTTTMTSPSPRAWWSRNARVGGSPGAVCAVAPPRSPTRPPTSRVADAAGRARDGSARPCCPNPAVAAVEEAKPARNPATGSPRRAPTTLSATWPAAPTARTSTTKR